MKITGSVPLSKTKIYTFKKGDLIIPSSGVRYGFIWKDGAKPCSKHHYNKATPAQKNYFWKLLLNGYDLLGSVNIPDYLNTNFRTFVPNWKSL